MSGTGPSHVLCWQTGCAQGPQRGQDLCPEHIPTWDPVWLEALLLLTLGDKGSPWWSLVSLADPSHLGCSGSTWGVTGSPGPSPLLSADLCDQTPGGLGAHRTFGSHLRARGLTGSRAFSTRSHLCPHPRHGAWHSGAPRPSFLEGQHRVACLFLSPQARRNGVGQGRPQAEPLRDPFLDP